MLLFNSHWLFLVSNSSIYCSLVSVYRFNYRCEILKLCISWWEQWICIIRLIWIFNCSDFLFVAFCFCSSAFNFKTQRYKICRILKLFSMELWCDQEFLFDLYFLFKLLWNKNYISKYYFAQQNSIAFTQHFHSIARILYRFMSVSSAYFNAF